MHTTLRNLAGPFALAVLFGSAVFAGEEPPYPPSPVIGGFELDWSTHQRHAPGSDNWPMTWASDDAQYTAWGDGGGFGGTNSDGRVSLGIARIDGERQDYRGVNVWGGKNAEVPAAFGGKSYGMLSVGGRLFMWLAPDDVPFLASSRIAWSEDRGRTWQKTEWAFTFEEGLTWPTFLNFGREYAGARDEYVYSYAIQPQYGPGKSKSPQANETGFDVHRPGAIYLSRVPRGAILNRGQYEFFAGLDGAGGPRWSARVEEKQPVFTDENGVGWNVSVSHVRGLGRYLLCTEHGRSHRGKLGIFDAPEPWGPWTTVIYEEAFGEGHVPVNTFCWSFPPKWISDDGTEFAFLFTGRTENDSLNTVEGRFVLHAAKGGR